MLVLASSVMSIHRDTVDAVNCDVIEAAKENIQPLASGRKVTALSTVLTTPLSQREKAFSAIKTRLRINVEVALADVDGDPLDAYCQFIYWTIENYPQGCSSESGLLTLLEEATRVLKDDREQRWRNDSRYLKLWLLYAGLVERPAIVFEFLLVNDIGSTFAQFYEEYSIVLEQTGRKNYADEIYRLGIARKAEPSERLQAKYLEFQRRTMASSDSIDAAISPQTAVQDRRPILGSRKADGPLPSSQTSGFSQRPNAKMAIFVDSDAKTDSTLTSSSTWDSIGTKKSRTLENTLPSVPAAGSKIKQAGKSRRIASDTGRSATSSLAIFRDSTDPETTQNAQSRTVPLNSVFSQSEEMSRMNDASRHGTIPVLHEGVPSSLSANEVDVLRHDPLKNHRI